MNTDMLQVFLRFIARRPLLEGAPVMRGLDYTRRTGHILSVRLLPTLIREGALPCPCIASNEVSMTRHRDESDPRRRDAERALRLFVYSSSLQTCPLFIHFRHYCLRAIIIYERGVTPAYAITMIITTTLCPLLSSHHIIIITHCGKQA